MLEIAPIGRETITDRIKQSGTDNKSQAYVPCSLISVVKIGLPIPSFGMGAE